MNPTINRSFEGFSSCREVTRILVDMALFLPNRSRLAWCDAVKERHVHHKTGFFFHWFLFHQELDASQTRTEFLRLASV
jgi:hypothetical protein